MKKEWKILAREYVVSFFPVFMLVDSLGNSIKRVVGFNLGSYGVILKEHSIWWLENTAWRVAHSKLVDKIKKQPKWLIQVLKKLDQEINFLVTQTKKLGKGKLNHLSNQELWQRYKVFVDYNTTVYDLGIICGALLDFGETTYFTVQTKIILKKYIPKNKIEEFFSLLTTSSRQSENEKQEIALLRIYKDLLRYPELIKFLRKQPSGNGSTDILGTYQTWYRKFKKHVARYAGIIYVYEGPAADQAYFWAILQDWARQGIQPEKLLKQRTAQHNILLQKQRFWFEKFGLSSEEKLMFALAQEIGFMKFQRRLLQSRCYYLFEPLLVEISRRLNLSMRQVRYLLPLELKEALLKKSADTSVLNHRIEHSVYINSRGVRKVLVSSSAERFWRKVYIEPVPKKVRELIGTVACTGRVRGSVCLVNTPADIIKMKPGEILVSFGTNPNLMPAIRQAAAIVTDEGGLTSHAAIVSREFKIPCVIGTKFATKVFKDGDLVEVDANKGVIKKL